MYDTDMIRDLENKFQSAALVELLKEPTNMILVSQQLATWRTIDEFLQAEKEAYDAQYKKRLEQLDVSIPSVRTASSSPFGMREILLILGGVGAAAFLAYNLTPGAAARRAEAKAKKIKASVKIRQAEQEKELAEARHRRRLSAAMSTPIPDSSNGGSRKI